MYLLEIKVASFVQKKKAQSCDFFLIHHLKSSQVWALIEPVSTDNICFSLEMIKLFSIKSSYLEA